MSITVNGATNTITAAAGLAIAGNTAVTGTLSATGATTLALTTISEDSTTTNPLTVKNTVAGYGNNNNFIRFLNSAGSYVGGVTHTAATGLGLFGVTDVKTIVGGGAGTVITTTSVTGLAVTGTLSATGDISITKTGTSPYLVTTRTGESTCYIGSQATENVLISRDSATGDRRLLITVGTTTRGMFDSNGLAVTGTLSATGITSVTDATDATSTTAASLKTAGGIAAVKSIIAGKGFKVAGPYAIGASDAGVISYESPVTREYVGDGTGYSRVFSKRVASVTTDLWTLADATGNVTMTGNLVMASGKGIDFSATANSSGTTTSEVLDDYEYGTWTPTLIGQTTAGAQTYTEQLGIYTKVGNLVTVHGSVTITAKDGAMAGNVVVGGLPFTVSNSPLQIMIGAVAGGTGITYPASQTQISCLAVGNTTYMRLIVDKSNGGGGAYIAVADIASTTAFGFTCTYRV